MHSVRVKHSQHTLVLSWRGSHTLRIKGEFNYILGCNLCPSYTYTFLEGGDWQRTLIQNHRKTLLCLWRPRWTSGVNCNMSKKRQCYICLAKHRPQCRAAGKVPIQMYTPFNKYREKFNNSKREKPLPTSFTFSEQDKESEVLSRGVGQFIWALAEKKAYLHGLIVRKVQHHRPHGGEASTRTSSLYKSTHEWSIQYNNALACWGVIY